MADKGSGPPPERRPEGLIDLVQCESSPRTARMQGVRHDECGEGGRPK